MQWLNVSYGVWFNRRRQRVGHLFQGRFKAIVTEPESWALSLTRYVHLNPVGIGGFGLSKGVRQRQREGLDDAPSREQVQQPLDHLREYRWSSYRAYAGLEGAPSWLQCQRVLERIGTGSAGRQRRAYREYVEGAIREGLKENPWEELVGQLVLGGAEFLELVRGRVAGNAQEQPAVRQLQKRPGWADVVAVVEQLKGESWSSFRDQHRDWGRDLALYLARQHCGLSLKELGAVAGGLDYRTVSWAITRFFPASNRGPAPGQHREKGRPPSHEPKGVTPPYACMRDKSESRDVTPLSSAPTLLSPLSDFVEESISIDRLRPRDDRRQIQRRLRAHRGYLSRPPP